MSPWTARPQGPIRRVLVTGADGAIGRTVLQELDRREVPATALSLRFHGPVPADRVIEGDASDSATVDSALAGVDGVIHLAAIPHPSLAPASQVFRVNTSATFTVLDRAAARGVAKVVCASSINAIGVPFNPHTVLPDYWPIDVDTPTDIADAYSLSKRVDELSASMMFRRDGMSVTCVRLPLTQSAAQLREAADLVALDPSDGLREGWSYLEIGDAARGLVDALLVPTAPGAHIVFMAAEDTLLRMDTAEALRRYAPQVPTRSRPHGRAGLIDTSSSGNLFGFTPRFSVHAQDYLTAPSEDSR